MYFACSTTCEAMMSKKHVDTSIGSSFGIPVIIKNLSCYTCIQTQILGLHPGWNQWVTGAYRISSIFRDPSKQKIQTWLRWLSLFITFPGTQESQTVLVLGIHHSAVANKKFHKVLFRPGRCIVQRGVTCTNFHHFRVKLGYRQRTSTYGTQSHIQLTWFRLRFPRKNVVTNGKFISRMWITARFPIKYQASTYFQQQKSHSKM